MKTIFFTDETNGTFFVRYKSLDDLPFTCAPGSYNVFKAKLFNLSYDKFLIMARNNYGAKIKGQNGGYMIEMFFDKEKAEKFCKELNKRLNKALDAWNKRGE